jgi:hypothetical protein
MWQCTSIDHYNFESIFGASHLFCKMSEMGAVANPKIAEG